MSNSKLQKRAIGEIELASILSTVDDNLFENDWTESVDSIFDELGADESD